MMKKISLVVVCLAALSLVVPTFCSAAEEKPAGQTGTSAPQVKKEVPPPLSITGTVTKVDKEAGSFELTVEGEATPKVFKASPKILGKIAVGDKVIVHYRVAKGGENKAVAVKKAEEKPKPKPKENQPKK